MPTDQVDSISKSLPCRVQQIELLSALLGPKSSPAIPSLFIYGHTATGKSATLKLLVPRLGHQLLCINCIECYSSRLLFETILIQLRNGKAAERCDNMNDFIHLLRLGASERFPNGECIYILLENSERLRDFDAAVLPGLLRLQELSGANVGVILESEIVWEKFRFGTGFREPYILHFSDYTKDELLELMCLDLPDVCPLEAYKSFLSLLLDIFYHVCHNLNELRYLASVSFRKYAEPVEDGSAKWEDTVKLWRHIEPHLKKSLQTVYLREISGVQWEKIQKSSEASQNVVARSHIELPVYSKFLLIAAYLASYNPVKSDKRFFSKTAGKIGRKSHGALKKNHTRTTNQILGPKVFPLDRLLAIFYCIVDDRVAPSASIFSQISSLVTLGLLSQMSNVDSLESPKYKCIVSLDFIKSVSRSVNFEVVRYIYDFL